MRGNRGFPSSCSARTSKRLAVRISEDLIWVKLLKLLERTTPVGFGSAFPHGCEEAKTSWELLWSLGLVWIDPWDEMLWLLWLLLTVGGFPTGFDKLLELDFGELLWATLIGLSCWGIMTGSVLQLSWRCASSSVIFFLCSSSACSSCFCLVSSWAVSEETCSFSWLISHWGSGEEEEVSAVCCFSASGLRQEQPGAAAGGGAERKEGEKGRKGKVGGGSTNRWRRKGKIVSRWKRRGGVRRKNVDRSRRRKRKRRKLFK